jgi:signal transduction histidine kinase/CheY-like chemotaxis protein
MKIGEAKHLEEIVKKFEDEFYWSLLITKNGEEAFFTENVLNVTGYTPAEINAFPNRFLDIICSDDLPDYKKFLDSFRTNPEKTDGTIEYRITDKSKKEIWLKEQIKVNRDKNGSITQWFGRSINITEFKNNLHTLESKIEELKQLNSSKDNFISVLSHDLRAPFTSILGFSDILVSESSLSEKDRAEYLKYINDSSYNQLQLINYLLDWSRLQTGRLKIEKHRLHAQTIIFNCVSALTGAAVRKNITIKVDIPDTIYIDADERLFSHVITSLISNSIKYSKEDTSVDVTANIFNDDMVEFIVRDEGIGISERNKEKLFNIGKVFSTEGTKSERGTGLGLALSKQIVEKHNGQIWFYTAEGVGSEFHCTIPASSNLIMLVKQDHSERTELIKKIKENFPSVHIVSADNGYEAMNMITKHLPTLIIIDHNMPLMNGIQFAHSVWKENRNFKIPIIAMIDQNEVSVKESYNEMGIKTMLKEPLNLKVIEEKIFSVLSRFN